MDIQESVNWYNQQQKGLGRKFYMEVLDGIDSLAKNPFYKICYDAVHCLPLKKFPFMVHYTVD